MLETFLWGWSDSVSKEVCKVTENQHVKSSHPSILYLLLSPLDWTGGQGSLHSCEDGGLNPSVDCMWATWKSWFCSWNTWMWGPWLVWTWDTWKLWLWGPCWFWGLWVAVWPSDPPPAVFRWCLCCPKLESSFWGLIKVEDCVSLRVMRVMPESGIHYQPPKWPDPTDVGHQAQQPLILSCVLCYYSVGIKNIETYFLYAIL